MSQLIPARPGYAAMFVRTINGHEDRDYMRVLAWGEDGCPWVMPHGARVMCPATKVAGYVGTVEDPYPDTVAMAPADGWVVRYTPKEGDPWTEPLIGWAVLTDGTVKALRVDCNGFVDEAECADDSCGVFHVEREKQS